MMLILTKKPCLAVLVSICIASFVIYSKIILNANETINENSGLGIGHRNVSEDILIGSVITRTNSYWKGIDDHCKPKGNFVLAHLKDPPKTPIIVYPIEEDQHVSGGILKRGHYEGELVQRMHRYLQQNKEAVFIDLGANIGMYSITLAAYGHRVIAIDVLQENVRRLCASMKIANLTNKMTIIFNAVSDKHENITIQMYPKDVGGTFIRHLVKEGDNVVQSICLDDLLEIYDFKHAIIKMDVEKSEDRVLRGAYNFFKHVNVEVVQLEFIKHKNERSGQFIVDFLLSFGLEPEVPTNVKRNYKKWKDNNIVFKRNR